MASDLYGSDDLTTEPPMLAAVSYEAGFPIDDFLAGIVSALRRDRFRLGGAIQRNPAPADSLAASDHSHGCCSDMLLVDLANGERVVISQNLGSEAQSCRLDASGLVELGGKLELTLDRSIDLMILNKFGRAEAEGGGFRGVIARAIDIDVPLLTAVRPLYREAWQCFHGGMAVDLAPEANDVLAWCRRAAGAAQAARTLRLAEQSTQV